MAENGVIHLLDPGTGQVLRHNICQIQDGKIILGGSGLLLTLIIPLKGDRGDPEVIMQSVMLDLCVNCVT